MNIVRSVALSVALACPAAAQDDPLDAYVEANLLSVFYHEFGHAMIDIMGLPVLGQEEDAADTASVLMIDQFFDEQTARSIIIDAANGFLDEDADRGPDDPLWSDTHGPDLQRYYNMVCQFYGADVEARYDLADTLQLPEERAAGCEDEFGLAFDSWAPILTEIVDAGPGSTIRYTGAEATLTERLIAGEVKALNNSLSLPQILQVTVASCGEANAYYDLDDVSITICAEFDPHLRKIAPE